MLETKFRDRLTFGTLCTPEKKNPLVAKSTDGVITFPESDANVWFDTKRTLKQSDLQN